MSDPSLADRSVMIVGLGGLGCPAAWALAAAGVGELLLVDDDLVDVSNLHRQILYGDRDVGQDKLLVAERWLNDRFPMLRVSCHHGRFLPGNALDLANAADVVLEGADNFATKFLVADACHQQGTPVVHGAAVRLQATVWSVSPGGRPCYRCLFEDVPVGTEAPNCAEAGVLGPVVGVAGALMAELALRQLRGRPGHGELFTYDGKTDRLRSVAVSARPSCPLCGPQAKLHDINEKRYIEGLFAAQGGHDGGHRTHSDAPALPDRR